MDSNTQKNIVIFGGLTLVAGTGVFLALRKKKPSKKKAKSASTKSAESAQASTATSVSTNVAPMSTPAPAPAPAPAPPVANLAGRRLCVKLGSAGESLNVYRTPFDPLSAQARGERAQTPYYTEMASRYSPSDFMSSQDFYALSQQGFIPQGFDPSRIVSTKSNNGTYKYMVGFSTPFTTSAALDSFTVISPEWAVVFDVDSSGANDAPINIPNTSQAELREILQRTLFAEWMLTRAGYGCRTGTSLELCNAERGAIANAAVIRALDKLRIHNVSKPLDSVFHGPGIKWNNSDQFFSAYNGYAGQKGFRNAAKIELPPLALSNFEAFYSDYWFMPRLALDSNSFIHPKGLKIPTPVWAKVGSPFSNFSNYASTKPIKIGGAVFIDVRSNFK